MARGLRLSFAAAVLLASWPGRGAPAQPERGGYEDALVRRALEELGRTVDPAPSGKVIRRIVIRSFEIISPEDPYPGFLNAAHVTTRPHVIRRELLFSEGQGWEEAKVAETERNLRRMFILAAAKIVALTTGTPGEVDALVVTRDLWSIRFNSSFEAAGGFLQYLRVRPTEQNLLGRDKRLSADLELKLDTFAVGQVWVDPRLFGSRFALLERANVLFNRATSKVEGSEGELRLERPLYSLETEWGLQTRVLWNLRRERRFRGSEVWVLPVPDGAGVPHVFDTREVEAEAFYTRSHAGPGFKLDLSPGLGAYEHRYLAPPGLDPAQLRVLEDAALPRSERAVYAALRGRAWTPRYVTLRDLETFSLAEDYQVGPLLLWEVRFANPGAGVFAEGWGSARYRFEAGGGLTTLAVAGSVRFAPGVSETWVNRRLAVDLEQVTPFVGPGRFAVRGLLEWVEADLDNRTLLLGGANGLRGTAPEVLAGTRLWLLNLEYRTRAVELFSMRAGAAAFWDVGAAWAGGGWGAPVHTVGLGLRLLFPQFDVEPLRIDFGWVVGGGGPPPWERASASFGQVTRYRPKMLEVPFD